MCSPSLSLCYIFYMLHSHIQFLWRKSYVGGGGAPSTCPLSSTCIHSKEGRLAVKFVSRCDSPISRVALHLKIMSSQTNKQIVCSHVTVLFALSFQGVGSGPFASWFIKPKIFTIWTFCQSLHILLPKLGSPTEAWVKITWRPQYRVLNYTLSLSDSESG